ncbi:T5orf172 domain-containing protein [Formivibrio citricus]|uniref:T5orf172 domain-containing protein n=1 Tax=Formivibrio citricus TaxID=83765 RepID=A0A1I5CNK4_9NEIS|nr:GIY-YIG nuclease family protein [Formivibrio citricus]SFN88558.1 T5orf172 domain-containing protein [Formivibrio citricus]
MTIPFEASRSYVYNAARYELLPRIAEVAKGFGDEPFLLREISKKLLTETYSPEQLEIKVKKAKSDASEKMSTIFGFYIPFLAENLKVFENLGGGMFRNISLEEEMAEADAAAIDVESDDAGIIYAYSFPTIVRKDGNRFPIKVGLTTTGDADARVMQQCKTTCCFEYPVVLGTWEVLRVAAMEHAIHSTLEARGSKRYAPGTEWFNTTFEEVESVIKFVQPSAHATPRP